MDLEGVQRRLQARLSELLARIERIEVDRRLPGSKDFEDRAIEAENDDVLERLDESERREIGQIRAALQRIERGSYATCAQCGEEIGARRLEALPYATFCVDCADREAGESPGLGRG